MRTFRSDNNAGLVPQALAALQAATAGHACAYGDDEWSARASAAFQALFGLPCAVFFVATGTAANTLAIAALTEPWQHVLCHAHSHYNDDESTAPERITHCRAVPIHTDASKLTPADLLRANPYTRGDVHQPQAGVLTLSNSTEFGTVYTPAELRALCEAAHASGYRVHLDGARFANAVASNACSAAQMAPLAGIDALSFGGTKNGLAYGEAVVFFPQGDGRAFERAVHAFPFQRKSTGHLLSKHRFVSAPFAATVGDGSWLTSARHANAMAQRLERGLRALGIQPRFAVEANGVFVRLPEAVDRALTAKGHGYYPFGPREWGLVRLMCSFDTMPQDVDGLLQDIEAALGSARR